MRVRELEVRYRSRPKADDIANLAAIGGNTTAPSATRRRTCIGGPAPVSG
jgi:hypothetical protein